MKIIIDFYVKLNYNIIYSQRLIWKGVAAMMVNSEKAMEALKKQLDQWESEGILEEKLKEHGFIIYDKDKPLVIKEDNANKSNWLRKNTYKASDL